MLYLNKTLLKNNKEDWIFNILLKDDTLLIRVLAPLELSQYFLRGYDFKDFSEWKTITKDRLLSFEKLLGEYVNIYLTTAYKITLNEKEYFVLYESQITKQNLIDAGSWHNGALCTVFLPMLDRTFAYRGTYSDIVSMSWYQDTKSSSTQDQTLFKYRTLLRQNPIAQFAVINENSSLLESNVLFYVPSNVEILTDLSIPSTLGEEQEDLKNLSELLIKYDVSGDVSSITAEDTKVLSIVSKLNKESYEGNTELTLEMLSGYSNHSSIPILNGTGQFSIKAQNLKAGDKLCFNIYDHERLVKSLEIPVV